MIYSQKASWLIITILLTLVVMTLGIYTLSKTKPFSENIQGLEQSVQARYNAQTGVEVAKLIYSEDSKKRTLSLDDADSSNDDFTPVDGSVVQNRTSVVIDPNRPKQQTNASEDLFSTEGSGVETIISSTTEIIPQACSGNAEIVHQPKEDGGCVYWNKLEPWKPVRINLSDAADLALKDDGSSFGGNQYSFSVRLRIPDLNKGWGGTDNPDETLFLSSASAGEPSTQAAAPMLTWNLYDDEIAFFPSEVESSITRFEVFQENRDNNALPFENWTGTSGTSLGWNSLKWRWEDTAVCEAALADDTKTEAQKEEACSLSLIDFFETELGKCAGKRCYLELNLVGDLTLSIPGQPTSKSEPLAIAPHLEYQIIAWRAEGKASGAPLKIQDNRPTITSTGESGGYTVREVISFEEENLIPTASSPIGR